MKKTLYPDIKIIDDFFEIPDLWREFGMSLDYQEVDRGLFLSNSINEIDSNVFHSLAKKISKHYNHSDFIFFESKFSYSTELCLDTQISQEDTSCDFSAVIFLNPVPESGSGISFHNFDPNKNFFRKTVNVENFYNRCIIYSTKNWLRHNKCFGKDNTTGRLIIKIIGKTK